MQHYFKSLESAIKNNWSAPGIGTYQAEDFTYGEVATFIERFHILMEAAGVKKGQKVALCAKNSGRWAIAYLGINTYEAVVVPILDNFTPENINSLVDHSESVMLFTNKDLWAKLDIEKMPNICGVVGMEDFGMLYAKDETVKAAFENLDANFAAKHPDGFGPQDVCYPDGNDKNLAVINYTSGTTSSPKGVMLRYESFSAMVDFAQRVLPCGPGDTIMSMLPMAHMYGMVFDFLFPVCSGVHVRFFGKTPSPTLLLKAMKEVKPFMVLSVPLVMEKIYKSSIKPVLSKPAMKILTKIPGVNSIIYKKVGAKICEAFGGNVKHFIMGGAPLNPEAEAIFKKIGLPYTVGYGMTEACPLLAYEDNHRYVQGSCGKLIDVCDLRIDSEDPQRIAGEIQAKGINVCMGYFNNEEASANAFTEDGWLRTGDLGIIDANNNVFIRGRSKSMILSANGQNIYPEEVEAIVNNQSYVAESVVVDRSTKLVALVYLDQEGMKKDGLDDEAIADIPENVRVAANRQLPNYSQITKVEVVSAPFEKTPKMSIKRFLYK